MKVLKAREPPVRFTRDVMPVLAGVGCNAGTCHGAAKGKNGFKLSLRGYDAEYDYNALVNELGPAGEPRRSGQEPDAAQADRRRPARRADTFWSPGSRDTT